MSKLTELSDRENKAKHDCLWTDSPPITFGTNGPGEGIPKT